MKRTESEQEAFDIEWLEKYEKRQELQRPIWINEGTRDVPIWNKYKHFWRGALFPSQGGLDMKDPDYKSKLSRHLVRCKEQYQKRIIKVELYESMKFNNEKEYIVPYRY